MVHLQTRSFWDNHVFHQEAFSLLIPRDWNFSGGLIWRQHPTMPAAASVTVTSMDGHDQMMIMPSFPYAWNSHPMGFISFREGSFYMGNEVRRPPRDFLHYVREYLLPQYRPGARIVNAVRSPELIMATYRENGVAGPTQMIQADGGIVHCEFSHGGRVYEEKISCALLFVQAGPGNLIWVADKLISTRSIKSCLDENECLFMTILKSFKLNLQWFNNYNHLVQSMIRNKMQEIRNIRAISRMIHNNAMQISDMTMASYEARQASYDHISRQISESIRGVNSYDDPYKGYEVEFPVEYDYVYANPLGDYILTDNPNFNPNESSNLTWTLLEQVK